MIESISKMKLVFWGKGKRSQVCLRRIVDEGFNIVMVVGHENDSRDDQSPLALADELGIATMTPRNPNEANCVEALRKLEADVFVLGGYGKIITSDVIDIPRRMCVNLHGGALPNYRGSSPMNWALINGDTEFSLSIIQVDSGVDTGPVIMSATHRIEPSYTIKDLHEIANSTFPELLVEVLRQIENDSCQLESQDRKMGAYYPLRFPDDGLVFFDEFSAEEIHNRIRALTEPYPGAFSYYEGRKIKLLSSELQTTPPSYGESGRIYRLSSKGALVCAKDCCLWLTKARFADDDTDALPALSRYRKLATIRGTLNDWLEKNANS